MEINEITRVILWEQKVCHNFIWIKIVFSFAIAKFQNYNSLCFMGWVFIIKLLSTKIWLCGFAALSFELFDLWAIWVYKILWNFMVKNL